MDTMSFLEPEKGKEKSILKLPPNTDSDTDIQAAKGCVYHLRGRGEGLLYVHPVHHCALSLPSSFKPDPLNAFSIQLSPWRNISDYNVIPQTYIESLSLQGVGWLFSFWVNFIDLSSMETLWNSSFVPELG